MKFTMYQCRKEILKVDIKKIMKDEKRTEKKKSPILFVFLSSFLNEQEYPNIFFVKDLSVFFTWLGIRRK